MAGDKYKMNLIKRIYSVARARVHSFSEQKRQSEILEVLRQRFPQSYIDSCLIDGSIIGPHTKVEKETRLRRSRIGAYCAVLQGASLDECELSDHSYVSYLSRLVRCCVGRFSSIGPQVQIGLGPHPTRRFVSTYPAFYAPNNSGCVLKLREDKAFDDTVPATRIGHDVWIGSDVIIPGGIEIGIGAVVAAGSVVVKDVPPYMIVGGNPARIIRPRFDAATAELLLASAWWDWPQDKLKKHLADFADIDNFLRRKY
jgi:acetyltransferase-like isoleucine patch superfamily enzyme